MNQSQTLKASLQAINFWPAQFPRFTPQELRANIIETLDDLDVISLQVVEWVAVALLLLRLE